MTTILDRLKSWDPPDHWLRIQTIDAHTEGEPLRIIVSGYPELPGETILERRQYARKNHDSLRTMLMWEPRGHADMYGCVITPAVSEEADFGILFIHNEGYSSMCGHGILAVTKVVIETGAIPSEEPETMIRIDTPSGLVTAFASITNGKVMSVRFRNVPSYVVDLQSVVDVPGLGEIHYCLAFGGAYYAYVDAKEAGVTCTEDHHAELIEKGMQIKRAVMASRKIEHPFEPDLGFLYGTIFIAPPNDSRNDSRNVCIFAEGEVDRSPTGTGVSGRMAIHHACGEVEIGEPRVIESIVGTTFTGRVIEETEFGPYKAIVPEISGNTYITGRNCFLVDPDDPLKEGFILR